MQQQNEQVLHFPPFIGLSKDNPVSREQRMHLAESARRAVYCAKSAGWLIPVRNLYCVDCGGIADHYDHRNYLEPLNIEPVCIGCNVRRGPALPLTDFKKNFRMKTQFNAEKSKDAKRLNKKIISAFNASLSRGAIRMRKYHKDINGAGYCDSEIYNKIFNNNFI